MAKAHEGAGYLCTFPERLGAGRVLMRYLSLELEERLRKKHTSELGILDGRGYLDARAQDSIAEVSPNIANDIAVQAELSAHGLVPVDATPPGRAAVWDAIGPKRRELLRAAFADRNTVDNDDVDPFLEEIEDVV